MLINLNYYIICYFFLYIRKQHISTEESFKEESLVHLFEFHKIASERKFIIRKFQNLYTTNTSPQ